MKEKFLSVRMPEAQSRLVKSLAASLGLSLQEVVSQALDAWILQHGPKARRRRNRQSAAVASQHAEKAKPQVEEGRRAESTGRVAGTGDTATQARATAASGWEWLSGARRLDWSKCSEVELVSTKVGRVWIFRGTRVPLPAVLRDFMDGLSMEEVLARCDGLTAKQVKAVLQFAVQGLAPSAAPR
jgi:uncharacterized protein (DUF433 family)